MVLVGGLMCINCCKLGFVKRSRRLRETTGGVMEDHALSTDKRCQVGVKGPNGGPW